MKFKLIPVDFDLKETDALTKAVNFFNSRQNVYSIEKDSPRTFNDDNYINWNRIYNNLYASAEQNRIIAVTSKPFDDNWFSHTENKITVISTSDWRLHYSPPGIHCYLLIEFVLSSYFHSSDFGERESKPHSETIGCLMDLCQNKNDMIWKLRVGCLCAEHSSLFLSNGGSETQLKAIKKLLEEVRTVTLGDIKNRSSISKTNKSVNFSIDSLKTHPLVVAGIILSFGLSMGWGVALKVWIEPQKSRIELLEKEIEKSKSFDNINDKKKEKQKNKK